MEITFSGVQTDYAIELIDWFKKYDLQYDYTKGKYGNTLIVDGVTKVCVGLWGGSTQIWVMMTPYDEDQFEINQNLVRKVFFE